MLKAHSWCKQRASPPPLSLPQSHHLPRRAHPALAARRRKRRMTTTMMMTQVAPLFLFPTAALIKFTPAQPSLSSTWVLMETSNWLCLISALSLTASATTNNTAALLLNAQMPQLKATEWHSGSLFFSAVLVEPSSHTLATSLSGRSGSKRSSRKRRRRRRTSMLLAILKHSSLTTDRITKQQIEKKKLCQIWQFEPSNELTDFLVKIQL